MHIFSVYKAEYKMKFKYFHKVRSNVISFVIFIRIAPAPTPLEGKYALNFMKPI